MPERWRVRTYRKGLEGRLARTPSHTCPRAWIIHNTTAIYCSILLLERFLQAPGCSGGSASRILCPVWSTRPAATSACGRVLDFARVRAEVQPDKLYCEGNQSDVLAAFAKVCRAEQALTHDARMQAKQQRAAAQRNRVRAAAKNTVEASDARKIRAGSQSGRRSSDNEVRAFVVSCCPCICWTRQTWSLVVNSMLHYQLVAACHFPASGSAVRWTLLASTSPAPLSVP